MIKNIAVISLVFLLAACAVYPKIPEKYLEPRPERTLTAPASSSVKAASLPVIKGQQPAGKILPAASSKDLDQFSEKEKEILVFRAYEFLLQQEPMDPAIIRGYPDLKRFGNEVVLETSLPNGTSVVRKGYGGNLLANVTQAASSIPRSVLQDNPFAYFKLTISPLELICWGKPVQWVEVLEGRYYLPVQVLSDKFVFERWRENQGFLNSYWKNLDKSLDSIPSGGSLPVLPSIALLRTTPPFQVRIQDGIKILREKAFARLKDFDPELSYVALPDGRMDVEGTASLLLLLLADQERTDTVYLFKRLAASLRFIQNEDGSFQTGVQEGGSVPKGDLRVPLILKVYYVLYQHGQTAFLEAFKRSFSYYFPANFNMPHEAAERLAWGRLLVDLGADPGDFAYENYLKGILDWFFQNILSSDQAARTAVGSFSGKITQDETVSRIEIYELLTEGYRHFKSRSPQTLLEAWSLKLFFATRSFLNLQIEGPDLMMGNFHANNLGGFSIDHRRFASFQDQLWAARALTEALRFWGAAEWAALKEKAEAQL